MFCHPFLYIYIYGPIEKQLMLNGSSRVEMNRLYSGVLKKKTVPLYFSFIFFYTLADFNDEFRLLISLRDPFESHSQRFLFTNEIICGTLLVLSSVLQTFICPFDFITKLNGNLAFLYIYQGFIVITGLVKGILECWY